MSSRDTRSGFEDILTSGDAIASFLSHVINAIYRTDLKTKSAVERQLQNLTEAAFRLGTDAEKLCPEVHSRAIRGLGNVLRHEYDEIQDEIIWQPVQERLPLLRASVESALARLHGEDTDEPA